MKNKIFALFILAAFVCLPLAAPAYEHNFPAGSIIIPMDTFYQPEADGGQLEAYGLVYYLLDYQDQDCLTAAATDPVVVFCQESCADGDTACEQTCLANFQQECEHTVGISWLINDQKTTVDGVDLVIEDNTLPRDEGGVTIDAVVKEYDHAGGTAALTFNGAGGDSARKITYSGSLFVIDIQDLAAGVEDEVYAIINSYSWNAVEVHVAQVPFAAPVFRDMRGTPPKIALMNSGEDKTTGNASILEGYLRLAGICSDSYEIVTPNEIAGFAAGDLSQKITPILKAKGYDFLWAPHWDAADAKSPYDGTNGLAHEDDVVKQIDNYLKSGKGMLAECASIETFEHNPKGRFLTDKGLAHNGVDINAATNVVYSDVTVANAQIGNHAAGFVPQGGHLHNWRPLKSVDLDPAVDNYNFFDHEDQLKNLKKGDSVYTDTVKRFTTDSVGTETVDDDWDYFVGGYAHGNNDFGYVVYLGGHSYASCTTTAVVDSESNAHPLKLEFTQAVYDADFTIEVNYTFEYLGHTSPMVTTGAVPFASDDLTAKVGGGDPSTGALPLQVDFTAATVDATDGKKFYDVIFRNTFPIIPLDIQTITVAWTGGGGGLKIKKLEDLKTDIKHYDSKAGSHSVFTLSPADFGIDAVPPVAEGGGGAAPTGCTDNADCSFKNLAGVRYVLNTLLNIKYQMISHEYVRAAPIVDHPWLYQGVFEHPSYYGHFRRFNVEAEDPAADWDTAVAGRIAAGQTGNSDGRKIYTAAYNEATGDWSKVNFDAAHVAALTAGLDVEPDNGDPADEIKVIERLRGRDWDYDNAVYVEQFHNKLGGIMHSAPAIIRDSSRDSRFQRTKEIAYVGDLYGMLHAIDTATGIENWAYIPSNLLGKLKNDRTDPNVEPDFAAVDGSPTARDIYWDHDGDGHREWRTILVCTQGSGGNSIFALDVTDPINWQVLWEATDDVSIGGEAPGGGMGHAFRAAIDKVKVPVIDDYGHPVLDGYGNPTYTVKWMVYVATSFVDIAEAHGGINVFAFDLRTGTEQWTFSSTYADSVNDIPGAVTTCDIDGDTLADRIFVGDMNGRMWELALTDDPDGNWTTGHSVHIAEYPDPVDPTRTLTKEIPLFNADIGNPISVSPAIVSRNGHRLLIFGTGGADWASNVKGYHVYAVDVTAAGALTQDDKDKNCQDTGGAIGAVWSLATAEGEKVWSSPTISAGQIWIVTSFGTMESADPKSDTAGSSNLRVLDLDTGQNVWDDPLQIAKVRGSVYVSRKHVYMTTIEGEIVQLGDEDDFSAGIGNRVVLKSWLHQTGAAGTTTSGDQSESGTTDDQFESDTPFDQTERDTIPPPALPIN
jgi:hypothetical protein